MINRRSSLGLVAGSAAAVLTTGPALSAIWKTLEQAAAQSSLTFGAAVRLEQLTTDHDYATLLLSQCSQFTPEIGLKWAVIEPRRGALDFSDIDQVAAISAAHGKSLRGHTLLWHRSIPSWAVDVLSTSPDWSLISRYFASVIPRFGDTSHVWDVVNEPIETGSRIDGLRQNILLQAFGPDYISRALHEARVFAPKSKLYINEYDLEYDNEQQRARRYLLLKLLERLKTSGAPVDGLGLESHLDLARGSVSRSSLIPFLKELENLGIEISITELDVKEADYIASPEARDQKVADEVRRYLDIVLSARGVKSITTWGLGDRFSWLNVTDADKARFPGAWQDGQGPGLNRGLPFDSNLKPKPFFYVLREALLRR